MDINLDPKEVKAHLDRLGYCNITAEQLKEFIKDLKKLIKYDRRLLCTCKYSPRISESSCIETSPELKSYTSSSSISGFENSPMERQKVADLHNLKQKHIPYTDSHKKSVKSFGSSSILSYNRDVPDTIIKRRTPVQFSLTKDSQKTKSIENLHGTGKPKSSFIRPWNIPKGLQVGIPKRSDPVKLYHHYQDIWRQQKFPGEDGHPGLRWCVREKMLGEYPQPRPVSRASSTGTLSRQQMKV